MRHCNSGPRSTNAIKPVNINVRHANLKWLCYVHDKLISVFISSSSSRYRSEIQNWNVTLTTVRLGQVGHLSRMYSKRFHFLQLKLYTTVACYAVDGSWPAILAWRAVLKASISCMSVIEDGSLFQPCMVLGKNDILYTVTLVYGSKNFWDPRVLLSFDQTMDSASGISTKLCLILKSLASSGI